LKVSCSFGCTAQKNAQAMRAYQLEPLAMVVKGQAVLVTRQVGSVHHLQMFAPGRVTQTFCGLPVHRGHRKGYLGLQGDKPLGRQDPRFCPQCAAEAYDLMLEFRACSASL
jgi:hypothetical protein